MSTLRALARNDRVFVPAMLVVCAAAICLRMPEIIAKGRFWCEEGNVFFHDAWVMPPGQALFNSFGGYLNLVANAAPLLARWTLPVADAPYLTIAVALLFQLCPLFLLLSARDPWLASPLARIIAVLLVLFVPAVEEIWLNSLHCQFQLTLCCGIIVALRVEPPSAMLSWFRAVLLLLAPLCGPGAIALLPLFLLRAALDRDRLRLLQAGPLLLGAVLQLALFFHVEHSRGYALDPVALLDIVTVRHIDLPFLGIDYTGVVAPLVAARRAAGHVPVEATLLPLLVFGPFLVLTLWRRTHAPAFWLLAAGGTVACASYFGAIGGADGLIHARAGGRYIFAPQALFSLSLLALACTTTLRTVRTGAILLVAWLLALGGAEYAAPWPFIADGPSWRQQVAMWRENPAYAPHVWPYSWAPVVLPVPPPARS